MLSPSPYPTEAVCDSDGHEILRVLGGYASRGLSAVVAAKPIAPRSQHSRKKATCAFSPPWHPISNPSEHQRVLRVSTRDTPVVATLVRLSAMALEQQAMNLLNPADPLGIGDDGPPLRACRLRRRVANWVRQTLPVPRSRDGHHGTMKASSGPSSIR